MREILFRGKRIDNGEWVYGLLLETPIREYREYGSNFYIVRGYAKHNDDGWHFLSYLVDEETISQFTGLTDKNGTKIFEGDVFAWNDNEIDEVTGKPYPDEISVVCFHDKKAAFVSKTLNGACESLYETISCENSRYIGNIHDNPELLKGGG